MSFNRDAVSKLLAECHRRCCICHSFCGVKIETDHIVPSGEGGGDEIGNAIPLCFECHAEVHSYNNNHPRGRKYLPEELRLHKEQWLKICADTPAELLRSKNAHDVGPIQALIDELEYNRLALIEIAKSDHGGRLELAQFRRAIQAGAVSILSESVRDSVNAAYAAIGRVAQHLEAEVHATDQRYRNGIIRKNRIPASNEAMLLVAHAIQNLYDILGSSEQK